MAAIKIQTETSVIPVIIGDLEFGFEVTDENIQKLYGLADKVQAEIEEINTDDFEGMKEVLKRSYDFLLGEGTFDKFYKVSPSVIIVTRYLYAIMEQLEDAILEKAGKTSHDKVQKYLQQKNKQNKAKSKKK